MSKRILLGPRDDLVRAAADAVVIHGRDASKTAVVFPGKRPGHFLRRELARRLGGSFIPPQLFSIDEFIQRISEQIDPAQGRDLDTLDAVAVLAEIHRQLPERLGGDAFRSLDLFLPIGFKLFGELEELRMSGADSKRILAMLEPISYDQRHTLGRYYTAFYDRVREIGRTTRAMRYTAVADRIAECPMDEFERIVIAGLYKLTPVEQRILDDLGRREATVLLFQSDKPADGDRPPAVRCTTAPDVHGQVFELAGALR
jgi:ATP-dependent helicase/nuclease subunit B